MCASSLRLKHAASTHESSLTSEKSKRVESGALRAVGATSRFRHKRFIVFRERNGFETEVDVLRYPRLQAARGHEAPVGIVRGIIAVEAMRQCLLLHIRCELGNQQGMPQADVSGDECVCYWFGQVQEL